MSDEHDHETDEDNGPAQPAVDDADGGGEDDDAGAAAPPPRDPLSPKQRLQSLMDRIRSDNRNRIGTLVLHAPLRDIEVTVDGDAALRAIAVFAGSPEYHDPLTPELASAGNGWLGIDFSQLIGVTWLPVSGDRRPGRMTLDPAT